MNTIFAVVGENRDDPDRLLLVDSDGQHYDYQLLDGATTPVQPDRSWIFDPDLPPFEDLVGWDH